MGANQGRLSGKSKKGKKGAAAVDDKSTGASGGARTQASPPQAAVKRAPVAESQPRNAQLAAPSDRPPPSQRQPIAAATAAQGHTPASATGPLGFDEHSHPFHAPLDYLRDEERPLQELSASTHFDVPTLRKLQVIFTDIAESDVDDGIIDGNELTDAMGLKSSCLLARTIFRIFDITHQKQIDFAQWVRTISALTVKASLEEKIKFSFSLYDLNGDGEIDVEELRAMLEAAVKDENVLNLSDAEVSEWCSHTLSQVDRDGNGKVDYEEYRSMVANSTKFLESFTLDIHALCASLKFKRAGADGALTISPDGDSAASGNGSVGGSGGVLSGIAHALGASMLTSQEMDQRLHWFRARKRENSQSEGPEDGDSSSRQNGSNSEHNPNGSNTNARLAAPTGPAPTAAGDAGTVVPAATAATAAAAAVRAAQSSSSGTRTGSGIKTGSGLIKPVSILPSAAAPAAAAPQSHFVPTAAAGAAAPVGSETPLASLQSQGGTVVTLQPIPTSTATSSSSSSSVSAAPQLSATSLAPAPAPASSSSASATSARSASANSSTPAPPVFHEAEPTPSPTAAVRFS